MDPNLERITPFSFFLSVDVLEEKREVLEESLLLCGCASFFVLDATDS
jgi:hypothetical protein